MLGSVAIISPATAGADLSPRATSRPRPRSTVVCARPREYPTADKRYSLKDNPYKLWWRELSFLQKTEEELTDYCTTLEGDDCYSCWMAYFELKDLEEELPKQELEQIVKDAIVKCGFKPLIQAIHRAAELRKNKEKDTEPPKPAKEIKQHKPEKEIQPPKAVSSGIRRERPQEIKGFQRPQESEDFHVPDGLPPTPEEYEAIQEAERARMSEPLFTRLLMNQGRLPTRFLKHGT